MFLLGTFYFFASFLIVTCISVIFSKNPAADPRSELPPRTRRCNGDGRVAHAGTGKHFQQARRHGQRA